MSYQIKELLLADAATLLPASKVVIQLRRGIKVDDDLPMDAVALVSCGVATGWGSATKRADTQPGDTVVVVGIGGIGINAVQGARMAGAKRIIAIDPVEFKREKAMEMGATHTFPSMAEAMQSVNEITWGEMADRVIMTPGVLHGDMMEEAMALVGKGGTCVVTAISPMTENDVKMNLFQLAMWNKEVKGTIFGSLNPRADIPALRHRGWPPAPQGQGQPVVFWPGRQQRVVNVALTGGSVTTFDSSENTAVLWGIAIASTKCCWNLGSTAVSIFSMRRTTLSISSRARSSARSTARGAPGAHRLHAR